MSEIRQCVYRRENKLCLLSREVEWSSPLAWVQYSQQDFSSAEDGFLQSGVNMFCFWPKEHLYFVLFMKRKFHLSLFFLSCVKYTLIYNELIHLASYFKVAWTSVNARPSFFLGKSLLFFLKLNRSIILFFLSFDTLPGKKKSINFQTAKPQSETVFLQLGRGVCGQGRGEEVSSE